MDRDEIITKIQLSANDLGMDNLSLNAFCRHSGVYRSVIYKYFDSWSEACKQADVKCGLGITNKSRIKPAPISKDECISELRRVADLLNRKDLSSNLFDKHATFTHTPVRRIFGSWHNALQEAGLELCEKSRKRIPLSVDECVTEIKRVAILLNTDYLTVSDFNKHANISSYRILRVFKTWHAALEKAEINASPAFIKKVTFSELSNDFLKVTIEISRIPTIIQLVRRSTHVHGTFSKNYGGYGKFKIKAIDFLIDSKAKMPYHIKKILQIERQRFNNGVPKKQYIEIALTQHSQGRTLNFRSFVYAPTSESDVVALFGAVAEELGFEIISTRQPFPDCEARRKVKESRRETFKKCLIEFEFSSLDYKKHKHPINGCDLIVCWIHNWKECPIEVMELDKEIRRLPGWK